MKRRVFLVSTFAAVAAFAMAPTAETKAGSYGMAGCGLGSMVIKDNGILQIFAATTNGTSANQTFGITTGTSNCTPGGAAYREKQQEVFVSVNFESLEKEMAAGKGEKLDAFAAILGCRSGASFGSMARDNYDSFFTAETTPSSLLAGVKSKIGAGCDI